MLSDRVRRSGPECAMVPDDRGFREGGALRFLRIAIRCTADVIVQMQLRRMNWPRHKPKIDGCSPMIRIFYVILAELSTVLFKSALLDRR